VLKLGLSFSEALTETEIFDIARAMEVGIDAADVVCEGPTSIDTTSLTFDYEVTLTVTIPKAQADVSMEVAAALTASIELLPELEGASIALTSFTDGEKDAVYVTPSPTVKTKPVVLKLSVSLEEALTETEITDTCSAMVNDVSAEAGIDAAGVMCEMTAYNVATFDYNVVITLAIPEANGDVPMEFAADLVASIEMLTELEGGSVALTSITDGEKDVVYIMLSSSAVKTALPLCAALSALVVVVF
jgi:type III secretory pathway component EscV